MFHIPNIYYRAFHEGVFRSIVLVFWPLYMGEKNGYDVGIIFFKQATAPKTCHINIIFHVLPPTKGKNRILSVIQ